MATASADIKAKQTMAGFSLLEFLVAIGISLFLISGIVNFYISHKKTYQFTQALERMQDNGRIASYYLRKDIRMAGYAGCGRLREVNLHNPLSSLNFSPATRIFGFHNGNSTSAFVSPSLNTILQIAIPQTDVLVLQEASSEQFPAYTESSRIKIEGDHNFAEGNILLLANCVKANLLQVAKIEKQIIFPTLELAQEYKQPDSSISRLLTLTYYIANTGRKNKAGNSIYALYRRDLNGAASKQNELVEGVENMQIYYGMPSFEDAALQYCSADQVNDWSKIHAVKIALLLNSIDAVNDVPQNYYFQGKSKSANDRLSRREWDIYIALREV